MMRVTSYITFPNVRIAPAGPKDQESDLCVTTEAVPRHVKLAKIAMMSLNDFVTVLIVLNECLCVLKFLSFKKKKSPCSRRSGVLRTVWYPCRFDDTVYVVFSIRVYLFRVCMCRFLVAWRR